MGMGEPAHNLENVLDAIDLLGTEGAIGHKNLVFSTVGDRRVFERLPLARVKPALALSPHTTDAEQRAACCRRRRASIRRSWWRWAKTTRARPAIRSSINGHCWKVWNDGEAEIEALIQLLFRQVRDDEFHPVQPVEGLAFRRPAGEKRRRSPNACVATASSPVCATRPGQDVDGGWAIARPQPVVWSAAESG